MLATDEAVSATLLFAVTVHFYYLRQCRGYAIRLVCLLFVLAVILSMCMITTKVISRFQF